MIRYSRSINGIYKSAEGLVVDSPPNELRMNYDDWKYFKGIKFGDADTATLPSGVNRYWNANEVTGATLIAIGQAPQGVIWFRCGNIEFTGIDAHKLHIVEIPYDQISLLDDKVEIFPNKEDIEGDCHLLMVKYYQQTGIDFGVEEEAMTEFNDFLHGAWN